MRIGVAPHRLWPDGEGELDDVLQTAVRPMSWASTMSSRAVTRWSVTWG